MRPPITWALPAQGLVEYGLLLLFIALAVVGALTLLGDSLTGFYQTAAGLFSGP